MIFACRINGGNRIAKSSIFSQNGNISKDSVTVFAESGIHYFERIGLIVYSDVKLNYSYNLGDSIKTRFTYDTDSTSLGIPSSINVNKAFGTVTFTRLDSTNKIISGIFSFKVPIPDCDTLNFTDGRFDVRY
jgi:hypothetical protein